MRQVMNETNSKASDIWMTTKRLETLVDGIFAIAMTLLVLSLNVPQIPYPATNAQILQSLYNMSGQFFIYAMSFALLALFWRINHSQFYVIKKTDQALVWINILWLLFVALVPFSTNLVGDYGYLQVPMIFFNLNLLVIGLLYNLNWYYAVRKNFIDENLDQDTIKYKSRLNFTLPLLAVIAIGLTFITPSYSSLVYLVSFFARKVINFPKK